MTTNPNSLIETVTVGQDPGGFTIDPDGTPLSVANNGSDVACLAFTDPGKALANAIGIH